MNIDEKITKRKKESQTEKQVEDESFLLSPLLLKQIIINAKRVKHKILLNKNLNN